MARSTERGAAKAPDDPSAISRTQRKRDSLALQDLGKELTLLAPAQIARLELPEQLLEAVLEARAIRKFGALRRQLRYIGRLMHDVDGAAIAAKLQALKAGPRAASAHLHRLERWRARLMQEDGALAELTRSYPGCDAAKLGKLVLEAQREQAEARPPHSFRALLRELRLIVPPETSQED
jgi:ribosome-associated protein